jgi:hypothetical protein
VNISEFSLLFSFSSSISSFCLPLLEAIHLYKQGGTLRIRSQVAFNLLLICDSRASDHATTSLPEVGIGNIATKLSCDHSGCSRIMFGFIRTRPTPPGRTLTMPSVGPSIGHASNSTETSSRQAGTKMAFLLISRIQCLLQSVRTRHPCLTSSSILSDVPVDVERPSK